MAEEVMRQKESTFRGKTIAELKTLDVRESAKFMTSRARRAVLRRFDKIEKFVQRCEKRIAKKKKIRTHDREIVIVPKMVGMNIAVYSGKEFKETEITAEMIGHRLGEFSHSINKVNHSAAGIGATKSSKSAKK